MVVPIIIWLVVSNFMNFLFHNLWDNPSHLTLKEFKMVKTTSQLIYPLVN